MSNRDKDAELKLRTARFLWHMGYCVIREVALSGYDIRSGELKRYDLTDLDVLGIKFDNDLRWHTVIADCKSGKVSSVNRVFWLRGVMNFFGAERGYLVQKGIGHEVRELGPGLDISLLDPENLDVYEHDKELDQLRLSSFSLQNYDTRNDLWGLKLPKGQRPTDQETRLAHLYSYLTYGYWFGDEYRNVQQMVKTLSDARVALVGLPRPKAKLLAYTALTLYSVSLLKMCGAVIATKSADIHSEVRRYIFGGSANANDRYRLMKLLSQLSGERVNLEPVYYEDLLELSARIIRFSQHARDIPRYSDLILMENVLQPGLRPLAEVLGEQFSIDTLKLTKDIADFLVNTTGADGSLFEELYGQ